MIDRRVASLRYRADALPTLRGVVGLPASREIRPRQWAVLSDALSAAQRRLRDRIDRAASLAGHERNDALGELELELAKAFAFFDLYMDVLTQRHGAELGAQLAGCDALAADALRVDHPAVTSLLPPLVYCDRGLGASIVREEIRLPDGTPNPIALVQIPFSRLREKHTLTSLVHEVGHQGLARMELVRAIPAAFDEALARIGADPRLRRIASLWASELGPDFWTFCACGVAQPSSARELLAMPISIATRVSETDPHPPPVLRVLASFDWCRHAWGVGPWDDWEGEWLELYPLVDPFLIEAKKVLPVLTKTLFGARFRATGGRRLPELFDLDAVEPKGLAARMRGLGVDAPAFWELRPTHQLSVFRAVRDTGRYSPEQVDRNMTKWLLRLAERAA